MSAFVIYDAQGEPQSIGTVPTGPLPPGWTAKTITDAQFRRLQQGRSRWDVPTKAVVVIPDPDPEDTPTAREAISALAELLGTTPQKVRSAVLPLKGTG